MATLTRGVPGGHRAITADTAFKLTRFFPTNPAIWLNLQNLYDLEIEKRSGAGLVGTNGLFLVAVACIYA
jgi:plasmid maintenance system antidote protein VapI